MSTKPFYGVPLNTSINQTTEESTNLTSKLVPKMSLGILTTRPTFGFLGPTPDLLSHTIREWGLRICILKGLQKIMFSTSLRTLRTNRSPSFPPCGSIITWVTNSQTRCFNSWSWFRKFSTKRARYGSWYTEYSKCVSHLTLTYMLWFNHFQPGIPTSPEEPGAIPRALEKGPLLTWSLDGPTSRKGGGEPARNPKS